MKPFLLVSGALILSAPVFAQAQVPAPTTRQVATEPSGYDLLVQAGQKILPGPNGGASNTERNILPEENLRRERLAVARNAPALALVRLALRKPVAIPDAMGSEVDFKFNAKVRELARQFSQESDVRFADGDYEGAMNSRLNAMELGAVVSHGVLISMLVGIAVEAIANNDAERIAARLDAAQCRQAVERLKTIDGRRTTLTETLRNEQKYGLHESVGRLKATGLEEMQPGEDGAFPTEQDIMQFMALTPEQLTKEYARLYDAVIESARLSYAQAAALALPDDLNPYTKLSLQFLQGALYRFSYDNVSARTRMLTVALELRAQKLESGKYPESFTTPPDPYAAEGTPLIYRKTGADYLLYSVGPDGKDNAGAEIETVEINEATGLKSVSGRLQPTSTGDLVQNPF